APATQIPIYEVGAVATDNVIAPFAFDVPKTEGELRKERDDVARATEPTFRFVPAALDTSRTLLKGFEDAVFAAASSRTPNLATIERAALRYGVSLTPDEAAYLASAQRRQRLLAAVLRVFERWVAAGVIASGAVDQLRGEILVRRGAEER